MSGRMRFSGLRCLLPDGGRVRGAVGYAYLAYFLALPFLLVIGPWVAVAILGQSVGTAIETTAGIVGGAYLVGLFALLR
ncbi:MAG: hypothetical protein R3324_02350 [Halobacteriales archaeon]|nr:hypothetical protein [Halobacteriales archaeon]